MVLNKEAAPAGVAPAAGGAAGPPIEFHATFVPAAGGAAGPPIAPGIITEFARTRDDLSWRAGGLAGLLKPSNGRGPPIESQATFVPAAGGAAGPPMEFHVTFVPVAGGA
jgi:hypothetical protein